MLVRDHYPAVPSWSNDYCKARGPPANPNWAAAVAVWVGRDSNPEATPKAFGAALIRRFLYFIQRENRELRIPFAFEPTFQSARLDHRWYLARRDEHDFCAEAARGVITSSFMLR